MIAKIQALFERRPAAVPAVALALVAALGWMSGSDLWNDRQSAVVPADRIDVPAWIPFASGADRAAAIELSKFAVNPNDAVTAAPTELAPAATEMPAGPDTSWRFVGTSLHGSRLAAVVAVAGGKKTLTLTIGETLPNGERITAIDGRSLTIEDASGAQRLLLFERSPK
jgi:hypothetical protein